MNARTRTVSLVAVGAATIVGVVLLVGTWDVGLTPFRFQLQIGAASDEPARGTARGPRAAAAPTPPPPSPPLVNPIEPLLLGRGEGMGMNDVVGYRFGEQIPAPSWPPGSAERGPEVPPQAVTVRPTLTNGDEIVRRVSAEYPANLRAAGIGGETHLWIHLDARGVVDATLVHETSGYESLDQVAMNVARAMIFDPAMGRDGAISSWLQIPIRFAPGR